MTPANDVLDQRREAMSIPKTLYASRGPLWPTTAQHRPGTASLPSGPSDGGRPAEVRQRDYAAPGGGTVATFRVLCEEHGEVMASPEGLCCLCLSPLEFVA